MRSFKSDRIPPPPISIHWPSPHQYPVRAFEIGGGTGEFASQYALKNPHTYLVSVERTKNKSDRFLLPQRSQEIKNLLFLRADAISVLVHCVPDRSLDRVFLLYPNPYPKKKQANQRWHNMSFMQVLKEKLKNKGVLELRTNLPSYMMEAKTQLLYLHKFFLLSEETLNNPANAETAFERKYLARGEVCLKTQFILI